MGKKFGTNSKAEEGRSRKADATEQQKQKARLEKEKLEEKKWSEGTRDESKRQEEEAKRLEKLIKNKEKKELEAQEAQELAKYKASANKSNSNSGKDIPQPLFKSKSTNWTLSVSSDGGQSSESIEMFSASNLDDALLLLESANVSSTSLGNVEKHPERRMKAAFCAFEAREMPILRAENPSLKHSQILERLHKMWKKSPENPFNQLHVNHNMTQDQQAEIVKADQDKHLDRLRIN